MEDVVKTGKLLYTLTIVQPTVGTGHHVVHSALCYSSHLRPPRRSTIHPRGMLRSPLTEDTRLGRTMLMFPRERKCVSFSPLLYRASVVPLS